jgi:hypothetical protein
MEYDKIRCTAGIAADREYRAMLLALLREDYNQHRPHSALDDRTPAEFAASWVDHAKAGLPQAVCLRHSLELQYVQICPSTRAEPNHASRNFQSFSAQSSGAGHKPRISSYLWMRTWGQVTHILCKGKITLATKCKL